MKVHNFFRLLGSFVLILVAQGAFAQDDSIKTLPPVTVTATSKVSEKVSEAFQHSFRNAVEPRWYKINKDYFVRFMMDDQRNHALYQKNGYMLYYIRYGEEKNLPEELRKQVKSTYFDYKIIQAINVQEANRNIWVVNLEGDKRYLLVRLEDGDMEEVRNIKKSM